MQHHKTGKKRERLLCAATLACLVHALSLGWEPIVTTNCMEIHKWCQAKNLAWRVGSDILIQLKILVDSCDKTLLIFLIYEKEEESHSCWV